MYAEFNNLRATNWRRYERNTLRGFCDLNLACGLTIKDCALQQQNGREWIGLPGKPLVDEDGKHRIDPGTGRKLYAPVVEIGKEERSGFQREALKAVHQLLLVSP
jgi:hypothetical protein